jgi:hypothetical protein
MSAASIKPHKRMVKGYPRLCAEMEVLPQIAIFRRFGALGARILLYMQAELSMLEERLWEVEKRDSESKQGKESSYCHDWYWLASPDSAMTPEQWRLVSQIKGLHKEYGMQSS